MLAKSSSNQGNLLIVEHKSESTSLLQMVLEEAGYHVQRFDYSATDWCSLSRRPPELVLLDVALGDGDGFHFCRQLKAHPQTQHIPVMFMLSLSTPAQVEQVFDAGAVDYVVKPIRTHELISRLGAQLQRARQNSLAHVAMDAFGQATLAIELGSGRLLWQTPLARQLMLQFYGEHLLHLPESLIDWLQHTIKHHQHTRQLPHFEQTQGRQRLIISIAAQTDEQEWLLVLRTASHELPLPALMQHFGLTARQAEVLYWVSQGKTSRDIGDILSTSPRTVNKHLEMIFEKLGVETRTAAATRAVSCLRQENYAI